MSKGMRKKYTREFKEEAVKQVVERGLFGQGGLRAYRGLDEEPLSLDQEARERSGVVDGAQLDEVRRENIRLKAELEKDKAALLVVIGGDERRPQSRPCGRERPQGVC